MVTKGMVCPPAEGPNEGNGSQGHSNYKKQSLPLYRRFGTYYIYENICDNPWVRTSALEHDLPLHRGSKRLRSHTWLGSVRPLGVELLHHARGHVVGRRFRMRWLQVVLHGIHYVTKQKIKQMKQIN